MDEQKPTYEELLSEIEQLKSQLSDKKQLEKELAYARILMQAAFDQSPVAMVVVTYPDFKFKIINKAMEDIVLEKGSNYLNKTPTEVQPTWQDCQPDGTPQASVHELILPKALTGVVTHNQESKIIRHDGSSIWVLASASPIYDDEDQLIGAMYVATDITERKKSEMIIAEDERKLKEQNEEYESINEELRETNEKLHFAKLKAEESDRLKTAFIQNMSHEIRTPMNAIMGFSDLLNDCFDDKAKLLKFAEIIRLRSEDLLNIINDILDISKIESGQLKINHEIFSIIDLFEDIHSFFTAYKNRIGKEQITFTYEVPDNMDARIYTDKGKLRQILLNLIGNSFKFTIHGSIKFGFEIEKGNIKFYVTDTGIGIPNDKHKEIFERFTQLNQLPDKNIGGTGLGLSIVEGLVKVLGGKIWLESEPDNGTSFYFTLPEIPAENIVKQTTSSPLYNSDLSTKKVLIVEDDPYNASFLKEVLSKLNVEIIHTEKGIEAVQMAADDSIDLILMDVRLPDISGYEATTKILVKKPGAAIIAQTAYAAIDEREKAIKAGCVDYISKPTKKEDLLFMIKKYLTNC